jgi:diguanylate cyclase (GGDEF)-like protein
MEGKRSLSRALKSTKNMDYSKAYRFNQIENLQLYILKVMCTSFILASITTIIYGIIDNHVFYSFIPHYFVILFYGFILIWVIKKKDAKVQTLSLLALTVYAFILYPPAWIYMRSEHPMIVMIAALILVMTILLFEGKIKWSFLALVTAMVISMFAIDTAENFKISIMLGKWSIGVGVSMAVSIGMILYCVNAFKNKFMDMNIKLYKYSTTDPLTGAYNSRKMNELLSQNIDNYNEKGTIFSIAMIDMDEFKNVNDTCGHDVGDDLLKECVEIMQSCLREQDVLIRYGGDEFVIIFPECDIAMAKKIAKRLLVAIRNIKAPSEIGSISFSAGITDIKESQQIGIELLKVADGKLYNSKMEGKSRISDVLI